MATRHRMTDMTGRACRLPACVGLLLGALLAAQDAPPEAPRVADLAHALAAYEDIHWTPATPSQRTLVPFALLQLKKARLAEEQQSRYGGGPSPAGFLRQGMEALNLLATERVLRARPGRLSELAYISPTDHTVQPYYLYLPKDYDPARKWPMLVFLHGYVPTISVLDPWILGEDAYATADRNGFVLLTPYGRRNTDFQGVGERDVTDAAAEAMALYAIDPDRVHLTGVSMGGAGCYYIGLRRPGRYAAISAMDGQSDMHTWWPVILRNWPASRDDIPPFRRWLVEWDNPVDLVMNARNQRFFVLHGERDPLVSVEQSRTLVRLARDLGIDMRYDEIAGAGHYIYWEPEIFERAWSWHRPFRREPSPARVTFKTFSLEYDTAFWCRIADFVAWGPPAVIDAEFSPDGSRLRVKTENVRLLAVDPATAPLQGKTAFTALVNGREAPVTTAADGMLHIVCDPTPVHVREWPPRKRNGLCGPAEEAFNTPFVVVAPTGGPEAERQAERARLERWVDEWDRFADGRPPVFLDGQVDDRLIATRNLVLFGTPETNAVLARIHDKLPIRIGPKGYEVAGKAYAGDDLGLVLCYPNPLNPERYVLIYSGELYGERCGINHKHDLIPDFIVFNARAFNYDDTNQHEVAGFFNLDWQLDPKLTWVRRNLPE